MKNTLITRSAFQVLSAQEQESITGGFNWMCLAAGVGGVLAFASADPIALSIAIGVGSDYC